MNVQLQKASLSQANEIWEILQAAIERRRKDGSQQWQDGYPNLEVIEKDINKEQGFVLTNGVSIIGYCAILINDEPEYANLKGRWLTNGDFVVFHRVAIHENHLGKGLAKKMLYLIEEFALNHRIFSIKADTNFDNHAMLKIFETMGYTYCGEVHFRGSARKAFEKVLEMESNN